MFFDDREVIYQEEAPSGRWRLTVYAPAEDDGDNGKGYQDPYDAGPTYFAEFEKTNGIIAVGYAFGNTDKGAELSVDWSRPGKVVALSLNGDDYMLFKWGVCFIKPRELNKVESEGPITPEEAEPFFEAALKENPE